MDDTRQPAAKKPCRECPFRKKAAPGWLGGGAHGRAADYLQLAHSDANVACHMSPGHAAGDPHGMRPCAGLALYRENVCKVPRNPVAAAAQDVVDPAFRGEVFGSPAEFMERHDTETNRRTMDRLEAETVKRVARTR